MPAVSFPLARQDSTEELGVWGCHPSCWSHRGFGRQRDRSMQSLAGGWHHVGSSKQEQCNKIAFLGQ